MLSKFSLQLKCLLEQANKDRKETTYIEKKILFQIASVIMSASTMLLCLKMYP